LGNLLGNAMKFTEDGQVTFTATNIQAPANDNRHWCRFSIQDTGIGITPESLNQLFQRFTQADASTTRRYGGSGLGLSICKHLIELMGGEIHVESQTGQGSRFWFDLPLGKSHTQRPDAHTDATARPLAKLAEGLRILVAEDNMINQLVIRNLLEKRGAIVTMVDNGLLALECVKTDPFDLILMDCQMPVMDGFEATGHIRAWEHTQPNHNPLPIIALTANAMASDRDACFAAGMTDFTTKPIKGEVLNRILQSYGA
jgi:CheY-like chemotaxis protein